MMRTIEWAQKTDAVGVASVLTEAAEWLRAAGMPIWEAGDVAIDSVLPDVVAGRYLLARESNEVVGVVRFQLSDKAFWPELAASESAFLHRLAVRRRVAKTGLSSQLIEFAAEHAMTLGKRYLRLDVVRDRHTLRAFYEKHGFCYHSDFQIGAWQVARYERLLSRKANSSLDAVAARQSA